MRGSETFWRALQAARRRNLAAAGEAMPVAGGSGIGRRALLRGLAAAGAGAVLPHTAIAALPPGGRVAIVGGGIAGLAALHHLTAAGIDARLYEARNRMGGRMHTLATEGARFEMGGQLVNSDHVDMRALCDAFGLSLVDRKSGPHQSIVLAEGAEIPPAALVEGLRPIAGRIAQDADAIDRDYAVHAPRIDRLSVRDYLDRHAALLPDARLRRLLESSIRTEYGAEPEAASALQLVFNLPTVHGERIEVLAGSDERYAIAGGSGALPDAMAARYRDRIETGRRLIAIEPDGAGVRLRFVEGQVVRADRVIVAVPAPILRQIDFRVALPPLWRAFTQEIDLGRNEKLQAAASAAPWTGPLGTGGELWDISAPYSLGWDGTVRPHSGEGGIWTWYLGGEQVRATHVPADFLSTTEAGIPGLRAALSGPVRRTRWCDDALTLGAYTNNSPGQLTRFAPLFWVESDYARERRQAVAGRVIFAGEHVSDAWVGFMNGGAQTGRLAAEVLIGAR